jgi:YidC/Oxa1 family membrane protein insertase
VAANLEDPGGGVNIWHQFVDYFRTALSAIADFYSFLGGHRWAAAIITLTLIVRTLLLPLAIKQIRSMREQQRLAPEIARLRQKHRTDRAKLGQETMALYQREGVNPYAACLPMVAQMPVLFAMYGALNDLGKTAGAMPFLGLGDLKTKVGQSVAGWLLVVIMTGASFLSTRMLNVGQTDSQRRLQLIMPLFFVFIFINYPAALMLYWTTQTVYQYVQQLVMTRDQREKGWRGILGIKQPDTGRPGAKRKSGGGVPQRPPKQEKPQVKPEVRAPEPAPAVAMAGGAKGSFDALASRRDLEEKRQRRRRNKKKRRRR